MPKQKETSCEDNRLCSILSCGWPSAITTILSVIMSYMFETHRTSVKMSHTQCNVGDIGDTW